MPVEPTCTLLTPPPPTHTQSWYLEQKEKEISIAVAATAVYTEQGKKLPRSNTR